MYAKSTRPSAKREVQKNRSAQRDHQIARSRRARACERSELRAKRSMRMCPQSGQIFYDSEGLKTWRFDENFESHFSYKTNTFSSMMRM